MRGSFTLTAAIPVSSGYGIRWSISVVSTRAELGIVVSFFLRINI